MTQIISAITKDYVLSVADRRLTIVGGPTSGKVGDDDTCKLVSLCNLCGIGYTGLARIENVPTHEWIAKALADERCFDPGTAAHVLASRATAAFSKVPREIRNHSFVLTGWSNFKDFNGLRPFIGLVSNMINDVGQILSTPADIFVATAKALRDSEDLCLHAVGQPLSLERGNGLERTLRRLVAESISIVYPAQSRSSVH